MKKTLLLGAALLAASTAFAQTWSVAGADVNGESWNASANDMTETSAGIYELNCSTLGAEFKVLQNHDWKNNLVSNGSKVTLGTPYSYQQVDDGGDNITLDIASNQYLTDAKIVLNTNAKNLTVTGTIAEKEPVDPGQVTYYIIGDDVNGANWTLAAPDAKFEDKGNGIYEWRGDKLGTGFKINNGTWDDGAPNYGSNGADLSLGVDYYYAEGGSTGNITFDGVGAVLNPVVVLNVNEQTVNVTGEGAGAAAWYIMGINNVWSFADADDYVLEPVEDEEGVYANVITVYETAGTFKIATSGWGKEIGTNFPDEVYINSDLMSAVLDDVASNEGAVNYELPEGQYLVTWDSNEYEIIFSTDLGGVEDVVLSIGGKAEYYNLHGQKVANPDKGIYIMVQNGKALKVVK